MKKNQTSLIHLKSILYNLSHPRFIPFLALARPISLHKGNVMMIKWSVRPLITILFLFSAAILWFRASVSNVGVYMFFSNKVSDATLLTFSAVDLADDSLRQNVEQLVEDQSSFLSYVGARSGKGGPMELMSTEFYKIRLDFQRNLQDWWSHRQFEPDVLSNLVNFISKIEWNSGSRRKYKTCAVVGNSGILLKNNQGETIDNHEFVIRINNARVSSFEQFVGTKTSLSFINSNILHFCSSRQACFCHPYGLVPIMMYMSQPVHFLDYTLCNSSHKAPLMITYPQLDILCARIVKYYSAKRFLKETGKRLEEWSSFHERVEFRYSSGMQAVMLALGVCDKVSIFGFGKSDSAKHYYYINQETERGLHDYQAEYDLYQDLVNEPEVIPFVSDKFKFPTVIIHR